MKLTTPRILLVAVAAGALGVVASYWWGGYSPLTRSEPGQRALQAAMDASAPPAPPGVTPARRGHPLPSIKLPDLDGKILDLASHFQGRPLLINVWASWCGPCLQEMPELQRFAQAQAPQGVQVLGLALDSPEAVRSFLRRVPVSYPIVLDNPGPADASVWLGNRQGVLPYTVLVDAQGRLLKQKIGPFQPGEIEEWAETAP